MFVWPEWGQLVTRISHFWTLAQVIIFEYLERYFKYIILSSFLGDHDDEFSPGSNEWNQGDLGDKIGNSGKDDLGNI